jgi:hypothetical protein
MMSQQSCFHFLFASAFASTGNAFTAAAKKNAPAKGEGHH